MTATPPQPLGAGAPAMANGSQGSEPYTILLNSTSDVNNRVPFATAPAQDDSATDTLGYGVRVPAGTPLLGGYIKIEMQNAAGVWSDVTTEILSLGISSKQTDGAACPDPTPNGIVRLERPRTTSANVPAGGGNCGSVSGSIRDLRRREEFSPLVFFDTREGELRDQTTDTEAIHYGGIIYVRRARREEPVALVRGHDRRDRQPGAERERVHRLLLRSPRQPQRRRQRDRRIRQRGHRQSRVRPPARPMRRSTPARTSTATASSTPTAPRSRRPTRCPAARSWHLGLAVCWRPLPSTSRPTR